MVTAPTTTHSALFLPLSKAASRNCIRPARATGWFMRLWILTSQSAGELAHQNGAGKTKDLQASPQVCQGPLGAECQCSAEIRQIPEFHVRIRAMLPVGPAERLHVRKRIDLFSSSYPDPLTTHITLDVAGQRGVTERHLGVLSSSKKQRVLFAPGSAAVPTCCSWSNPRSGWAPGLDNGETKRPLGEQKD